VGLFNFARVHKWPHKTDDSDLSEAIPDPFESEPTLVSAGLCGRFY